MKLDANLPGLTGSTGYPVSYGYCLVGTVIDGGPEAEPGLLGRDVFAFHPHATHAILRSTDVTPLPEGMDPLDAVFFPNMETAVNLVLDGAPLIGERVAVLGLGIVGLLTVALLARFPLAALVGLDRQESRRSKALGLGATVCPDDTSGHDSMDLVYELTGNPAALDTALGLCGFASRLCVGSWYGTKTSPAALGGDFHRNRVRLFSSQVSSIAPELSGRWTHERRAGIAWQELPRLLPARLVTHRYPLDSCSEAYQMIHEGNPDMLQVVFTY
jgi:threonine dehydrogenase-like Zn-dependent dehydrogenase